MINVLAICAGRPPVGADKLFIQRARSVACQSHVSSMARHGTARDSRPLWLRVKGAMFGRSLTFIRELTTPVMRFLTPRILLMVLMDDFRSLWPSSTYHNAAIRNPFWPPMP